MRLATVKPKTNMRTYHDTKLALGSDTTLVIVSDKSHEEVIALLHKLWLRIFEFEKQFSRFLPSSELSFINQHAGLRTPISLPMHDILFAAHEAANLTNGLYNPFVLPALQRAGYIKSAVPGHENDFVDDVSNRIVTTWDKLHLEKNIVTIPYNTALDLGGCGKGYLLEQLRHEPELREHQGYWLSLGGDVVGNGHDQNDQPWHINIGDGHIAKTSFIAPKTFTAATSGTTVRKGRAKGKAWHHLLDPRTLQPAQTQIRMATVLHASAFWADILASGAVILGWNDAEAFLSRHQATGWRIEHENGSVKVHGIDEVQGDIP